MTKTAALDHTIALVRCKSVTPLEGGALDYLQSELETLGFDCERLLFSEPGTPDVDNLYARIGRAAPHLCFAGHTDVVAPGNEAEWSHPPFAAKIAGDVLFGRGSADMKGGIACFLAAVADYLGQGDQKKAGSISFLITGHRSIFASQILAMKKSEMLTVKVGEVIEKADVDLEKREAGRIRNIKRRLKVRGEKLIRHSQRKSFSSGRRKRSMKK